MEIHLLHICLLFSCYMNDQVIVIPIDTIPPTIFEDDYIPPDNYPRELGDRKIIYVKPGVFL